ncbi:MAG: Imm27 family immunity protein [Gemmatimonadaceae bacterium]
MYAELGPDERQLTGAWDDTGEDVLGDEVDQRIFWLARHRLTPRASINGGWDQLFVDPRDGRLWELTFPLGSLFGGGPRRLTHLSLEEASAKYGV